MEFKTGQMVRQRGGKQVMTMKGLRGIAASSTNRSPTASVGYVVCAWTDGRGRSRTRAFPLLDLEAAE